MFDRRLILPSQVLTTDQSLPQPGINSVPPQLQSSTLNPTLFPTKVFPTEPVVECDLRSTRCTSGKPSEKHQPQPQDGEDVRWRIKMLYDGAPLHSLSPDISTLLAFATLGFALGFRFRFRVGVALIMVNVLVVPRIRKVSG